MTGYKRLRLFLLALITTMTMLVTFYGISHGGDLEARTYDLRKGTAQLVHPDPGRVCRLAITAKDGPSWGRIDIYHGFAKHKKLVGRLDYNLIPDERQVYEFEQNLGIGLFDINVDDGRLAVRVEQPAKPGVYPSSWAKTPANRLEIFPDAENKSDEDESTLKNMALYTYGKPSYVATNAGAVVKFMNIGDRPESPASIINIIPGLADPAMVSIESCNRPRHFIRVNAEGAGFRKYEADAAFREEATFRLVPGLADPSYASFESFAMPGRFIQHANGLMTTGPVKDDASRRAATFLVKPVR